MESPCEYGIEPPDFTSHRVRKVLLYKSVTLDQLSSEISRPPVHMF